MKKVIFSIALALLFLRSNYIYGDTNASQTITATLSPFVTISNIENSSTNTQMTNKGGFLTDLTPAFKFASNSKNGASVIFNIKVDTIDNGLVDAISGVNSSGSIVLANTSVKPYASAVSNALSNNPAAKNNANAISYRISFKISNKDTGNIPVFNKVGNTAGGNVLTRNGSNTVIIVIDKDSTRNETFSSDDKAGTYQAVIYCTSSNL